MFLFKWWKVGFPIKTGYPGQPSDHIPAHPPSKGEEKLSEEGERGAGEDAGHGPKGAPGRWSADACRSSSPWSLQGAAPQQARRPGPEGRLFGRSYSEA